MANPCAKPIVVTVLPSPSGVGVIAVTRMNLPLGLLANRSRQCSDTLALCWPWLSYSFACNPAF
ncbi:Uncharacterised protein [Vibrio cholerae]|nr:Uncharacterised protein [Vibrio cholerae]CSI58815.1 Uncharacterised protein [Vibrio cholerae]